jgi:8-oxo-dGTP pyrophosphatase MutT (NUDIX family)
MPRVVEQAGVIAVRDGAVCIITSSNGSRWVIPKGLIDPGCTVEEAAELEAWEEAGLRGRLSDEPVGTFEYFKDKRIYRVTVFRMDVTHAAFDWPERHRRREWVVPESAMERIREVELQMLIRAQFEYALSGA